MRSRFEPGAVVLFCVLIAAATGMGCRGEVANDSPVDRSEVTDEEDRSATLTGCLEQGRIPGTFVLTNASALDAPQEIGTSGTDPDESPTDTYALVNLGDTDLTRHVGSKVTVGGRFQAEGEDPGSLERAPELAERKGAEPDTPGLIVESVESAGEQCR
jgi:hypothetical protein